MKTLKAFKEMWDECTDLEKSIAFQILFVVTAVIHILAGAEYVLTLLPPVLCIAASVYFQLRNKQ